MGGETPEVVKSLGSRAWWIILLSAEALGCLALYAMTGGDEGLALVSLLAFLAACFVVSLWLMDRSERVQR